MKKIIGFSLLLISVFIIYQVFIINVKNGHEIDYSVTSNKIEFNINEVFEDDNYYFKIRANNFDFYITSNNYFNKVKKVIDNIKYTYDDNLFCIYPEYKDNASGMIWCSDGNKNMSYESVKDSELVQNFVSELNEDGIFSILDEEPIKGELDNISYNKNYLEDDILALWNYKGINFITKDSNYSLSVLEFDRYDNTLSCLIGEYYITPKYEDNKLFEVNSFIIINVKTNKSYEVKTDITLSNYSYINGVIDNKLYIFDKGTMSQIEIDPYKRKIKIVGNKDDGIKFYKNGWEIRNVYDFINNKITFSEIDESKISSLYTYDEIFENKNAYYLYSNGDMYRIYKNNLEQKILLFSISNIRNIQIVSDSVYFVLGDTLYKYNDSYGIRKIMIYKEFLYNSNKIIDIYGK